MKTCISLRVEIIRFPRWESDAVPLHSWGCVGSCKVSVRHSDDCRCSRNQVTRPFLFLIQRSHNFFCHEKLENNIFSPLADNQVSKKTMSGVELLPFVWALPLAYIAASYGTSPRAQLAFPGHLTLDGQCEPRSQPYISKTEAERLEDESIEVMLNHKGCTCFLIWVWFPPVTKPSWCVPRRRPTG